MRHQQAGRARTTVGAVIHSEPIYIYFSGTTSAAPIYTAYSATNPITVAPQIVTDNLGYFEFWVDDEEIDPTTLFDIICQGVTYDKIDIFKGAWFNPKKYFLQ
jgi:hypothetical protein